MRLIRKFFSDTVDMVLDGLAAAGLLRGGARWWRQRLRRRLEALGDDAETARRSVASRHRMCRECRALVPSSASVCPECGASMRGIPRGGAGRVLKMLAPSVGSVSTSLLGAILVLYFASALGVAQGISVWAPPPALLDRLGTMRYDAMLYFGQWWRPVTAVFLHGSLLHLFFNGLALANLGPALEEAIGGRRLLVLFVGTGVLSFVLSGAVKHALGVPQHSLGASGAIFGLIGFGIVHARRRGGMYREFGAGLVRWAVFGFLMSFTPGIDLGAHAAGFATGALGGLLIGGHTARPALERLWTLAAIAAGLAPVAAFAASLTR